MAEEHRFQSPEGHRLCANNCGFFGSPATMNLCSKCYRDLCLKEQQEASIKSTVEASLSSPSSSSPSPSNSVSLSSPSPPPPEISAGSLSPATGEARSAQDGLASVANRCAACRKRVGLTGFKCRCGTTFCGSHRYPEKHDCSFDFKSLGREEIARANPLVKAEKLDRI